MGGLMAAVIRLTVIGGLVVISAPDVATASEGCPTPASVDDGAASRILATERPFSPADPALFLSYDNPDWYITGAANDATEPIPSEATVRAELSSFLEKRFPTSPDRVAEGMSVFEHPIARRKIPDPTLRAALAGLTGTLGEPAIEYVLLRAPVTAVLFGIPMLYGQGYPTGNSAVTYNLPDGTFTIVIDGRYRANRFETLSALLFHEALHAEAPAAPADASLPDGVGLPEEATAVALESLVYMQMLLSDPSIAAAGDSLTRSANNRLALARLNSGRPGTSGLAIFLPGNTGSIDPLAVEPLTQFYDYYARMGYDGADEAAWSALETHGNDLLASVLPTLAEPGAEVPANPDFDQATLGFIDQNEAALSPADLIAVARILALDPACAIERSAA